MPKVVNIKFISNECPIFLPKRFVMADFAEYAPKLLKHEGGYVWHPLDLGGPTCKGVTLATYRQYYGMSKTVENLKNIPFGHWKTIMKEGYWDKCRADEIVSQPVAEIAVDWCVNSGTSGIRKVQEIAGTTADGIVGPKTIAAINAADPKDLFERIWNARHQFYVNIVKKNPSQKVFMNGWMNRLNSFKYEV